MGKLFKSIITSILFSSASSTENFQVTGCNQETTGRPALSFKIAQDYFENNLNDQNNDYTLNNGFYERTIEEADLDFALDDSNDQIQLSYTIATTSTGFDLDQDTRISYAENNIRFQCNYDRQINVAQSYQQINQDQPIQGQGELSYTMIINAGALGGTTEVQVIPNHGLDQIAPTFTECKVVDSTNTHEVYLMHSFASDSVCFDRSRLNVVQTEFSPNASFNMRTFRFNVDGSATESQQQTVFCSLHLDAIANISQDQASDCSCYTQTECEQRHHLRGPYLLFQSKSSRWTVGEPAEASPFTIFDPIDGFVNNNIVLNTNDEDHNATGLAGTCTVTFDGSQYILGGWSTNYIRKLEGCSIRYLGNVQSLISGTPSGWRYQKPLCGVFDFSGTDKILICNPQKSYGGCFECLTYDGTTIDTITHPTYCHAIGAMASSRGRPVAVEGSTPGMEIMDMTTFEWSQGAAQQFHREYITDFGLIQRDVDTFFMVGGRMRTGNTSKILKYDSGVWTHVGDLQHARHGLGLVFNDNELIILGGWGDTYTNGHDESDIEIWDVETETGRVDQELTQAMSLGRAYTTIIKIDGPTSCSGTN